MFDELRFVMMGKTNDDSESGDGVCSDDLVATSWASSRRATMDMTDSEEKSVGYSKNVMSLREDLIETKVPLGSAMQP
jgi:hypothetical protein